MPYVTGGAAFTRTEDTQAGTDQGRKNLTGWTIGAGVEWAFAQNWSAKVEYLHADFGHPTIFNPAISLNNRHSVDNLNIVRIGLNYKFDWGKGPVAAKY